MATQKKNIEKHLRIGLGKDVKTEHFPVTIASGIDALMELDDYKRLPQTKNSLEEFVWENNKGDRLTVNYYMKVDKISYSAIFNEDLSENIDDIAKRLNELYDKLNTIIGAVSQRLGPPYISLTRELLFEIEGTKPLQKAQFLIPIIRELYRKTEGIQLFNVDTLKQTNSSVQILFGLIAD